MYVYKETQNSIGEWWIFHFHEKYIWRKYGRTWSRWCGFSFDFKLLFTPTLSTVHTVTVVKTIGR